MLETITTLRRDALASLLAATAQAVGGGRPRTLGTLAKRVELVSALLDAVETLVGAEADEAITLAAAVRVHESVYQATRDVMEAACAGRWTSAPADTQWYEPLALLVPDIRERANKLGAEAAKRAAEKPCEACAAAPVEFDEEDES